MLFGVELYDTEYLLEIAPLLRLVLEIGILLGLVLEAAFAEDYMLEFCRGTYAGKTETSGCVR